ncbi:DDE 1 domain containing protein [Pyrenophora teres f. teres]|uniref:DDE 1 domain containing protein n=1 Tax=Pyrenophora teres f. teres TaxID=97479 RepID=A0A6S6VBS0_9PLEO|nr:DDE 1 domain containing protein [Pyrenophora teres f. teres]
MKDYDIATENTYNTDEKGFMLGITARSKRVFTRAIWEQNERRAAIQDGNREWISVIACICGDGSSLPPGIIYEGKAGIQSSWVCDLQPNLQEVFIAHSTSGWINNELGLAWLEQVFNRFTIDKARRRWRLLILDGHGSHVTSDFINFCDAHKILLAVFPPHSTHSLQPLDVIYSVATAPIGTSKGEFLSNLWTTRSESFRRGLILKSFQATGVLPMDAQAVLKRFNKTPQQQLNGVKVGQQGDGDSWRQLRNFLDAAVEDRAEVESTRLEQSLHSLQVQNELLHHENEGLRSLLNNKKKRNNKSKVLDLQHSEEYHGGAVFWSPRKVQRARELEATKQQEAEQLQLQKDNERDLKAAPLAYKKLKAEGSKAKRLRAKHEREEAKKLGLQSSQLAGLLNNSNATLQTLQNFTIQLELAGELPYASPYKKQGVVVLLALKVRLQLHQLRRRRQSCQQASKWGSEGLT